MAPRLTNFAERFLSYIQESEEGCLLWSGSKALGYGKFSKNGRPVGAHRVAWEMFMGPIPPGLVIDHMVCGRRDCVNPDHLQVCTQAENIGRGKAPSAIVHRTNICKKGMHALEGANVYWYQGRRTCIACRTERDRIEKSTDAWLQASAARKCEGYAKDPVYREKARAASKLYYENNKLFIAVKNKKKRRLLKLSEK